MFKDIKKCRAYGFSIVDLNGYNVYTCNISIDQMDDKDHPVIDGVHFSNKTSFIGKNKKEKFLTAITFITLDFLEYNRMKMAVGRFLKQHAENKNNKKYAWTEEKPSSKPEYTYEEYSAADAAISSLDVPLDF
jgi:hypothetical protein